MKIKFNLIYENKDSTDGRIIYLLILVGLLFNAVFLLFYQNNLEFVLKQEKFGWYTTLGFYGDILISIASVLAFFKYRTRFPSYVSICYILLLIIVVIASASDIEDIIKRPSIVYSTKGIGTFINFGILYFVAAAKKYVSIIFKLFYFLCIFYIFAGILNLAKLGLTTDRHALLFAIREFAVFVIWVLPYFLFKGSEKIYSNALVYIVFLLAFVLVVATGSRAYILIYSVFFIIKAYHAGKGSAKAKLYFLIGGIVLMVGVFVLIAATGIDRIIQGAVTMVAGRAKDDTRSLQLVEFFKQYHTDKLIQGVGPIKTWYWIEDHGQYGYLDNQFILLGWWAGLPAAIVYIFFLVRTFFYKGEGSLWPQKTMVLFWMFGCGGLAIYVTISCYLYYFFISLLIGTITCKPQYKKFISEKI